MGRSNVNAIQVGQDTKISICSYSHGRKRVPLAQTFSVTPKLTGGIVGEFDDRFPVMTYGTYEGCTTSFEHFLSDTGDVTAMIMDTNPAENIQPMIEPLAVMNECEVWVNYYSPKLGYQYGCDYVNHLILQGNPNTQTIKDPAKITKSFEGAVHMGFIGKTGQKCALQYTRFVYGTPTFATPDDVAITTVGTLPNAAIAFPLPAEANLGPSQNYVDCKKNGTQLNGNSYAGAVDFTLTGSTFAPTVPPTTGDVIEIWTIAQPSSPIS